jgi:thymidylate synthase
VKYGDLGPVYGKQWRDFNGEWVDQIQNLVERIKSNPECRRLIVSAWNPAQIQSMLLPPCHSFFQFNVDTTNNVLNLQLYQRSADTFLGVPFNIASYSTLLMLIAKITGYTPGTFVHTLWDAHIYQNHYDQVKLQLSRDPLPLPELKLLKDVKTIEDIEELEWEDFELIWYESHERIVAPVAV